MRRKAKNLKNAQALKGIIEDNRCKIIYLNRDKGLLVFADIKKTEFDDLRRDSNYFKFQNEHLEFDTNFFNGCTVEGRGHDEDHYGKATIEINKQCCKNLTGVVLKDAVEVYTLLDNLLRELEASSEINSLGSVGDAIMDLKDKQFNGLFDN